MQNFANLPLVEQGTGDNSGLTKVYSLVVYVYMGIIRRIAKRSDTRQINLPREVCDAIGVDIGDYLFIEVWDNQKIMMRKIDVLNNPSLRAMLPVGDPERKYESRD